MVMASTRGVVAVVDYGMGNLRSGANAVEVAAAHDRPPAVG